MKSRTEKLRGWLKRHKTLLLVWVPCGFVAVILLVQILYPTSRLLPFQQIDGQHLGGWSKKDAEHRLNALYARTNYKLYFGDAPRPQYTPKLEDIGTKVHNSSRIDELRYPWYLRLVPSSLFWADKVVDAPAPVYTRDTKKLSNYLEKELGGSCAVAPVNATAKIKDGTIVAVEAVSGGSCKDSDVRRVLGSIEPRLSERMSTRIDMKEISAPLTKSDIQKTIKTLNSQLSGGVPITYDGKTERLDAKLVRTWLVFKSDKTGLQLAYNDKKASQYLMNSFGNALARPAGVSKVTTHDFVEVSRQDGPSGRELDVSQTLTHLTSYLMGQSDAVALGEATLPPKLEYTRTYSNTDTGLSALMKNFAESHPGTYGVSMVELDGKRRRAAYQDDKKFTTASTYKLYVGYSTLKRIESGEFKWSDQIQGGRDLTKCFDDMIVKSDNACAEALVAKIGYRPLTTDAQSIVSAQTTFLDTESYKTTAGDLSTFMASLATGQISLNADSRAKFLDALMRNQYRQGIPAGASGQVADKVGFLNGLFHDAAIVYSPSGTYVLSVMTDGSSWATIAELTRELEKIRN